MANDIDTLVGMGFSRPKVQKAWKATNGAGLTPAMDWILSHPEVSDEHDEETNDTPQTLGGPATATTPAASAEEQKEEEGEINNGDQTAQSLICNDCQKLFRDAASAERHATLKGHQDFSESTEAIKPLTKEEKKQKLAELKERMAEKRRKKEEEEKAEEKQMEILRRKAGQDMTEVMENMERNEMKKMMDAKKKEKELDRIAKERVKQQIESDKRERQAKREARMREAEVPSNTPVTTVKKEPKEAYHTARLQIRTPDKGSVVHSFDATATLDAVHRFLEEKGINGPFTLATTFPRKVFGADDLQKTLQDLQLTPSAALVLSYTS